MRRAVSGVVSLDKGSDIDRPLPIVPEPLESHGEEERRLLAEVAQHVADGRQATVTNDYEKASIEFGWASTKLTSVFGNNSVECAELFFLYGSALFHNAAGKASLLGGEEIAEVEEDSEEVIVVPPQKPSDRFVFSGDESANTTVEAGVSTANSSGTVVADGETDEQDPAGESDEDDEGDIQIAWETLDLARTLFEKLPGGYAAMRVADVLMMLGDVSLEQGHWDKAIGDFTRAFEIKSERLASDHRDLAEVLYKLALANEFSKNAEQALLHCNQIMDILSRRLQRLDQSRAMLENDEGKTEELETVKAEIADVQSLLPDIQEKIEDLKSQDGQARNMIREAFDAVTKGFVTTTPANAPVVDVSNLVKSKASPQKVVDGSADGAKRKGEAVGDSVEPVFCVKAFPHSVIC
ncbi:hypothetical protein DFJ73DRAFT_396058 [Zopfochytrium polystomum]|nr:hypothetical protein DFJ73DRAFT_396058 [Zopfochytrium polystomum]